MSVFNSVSRALVVLILVLMLFGVFTGAVLADAEILKPYTGRRMDAETKQLTKQRDIELEAQAKIAAAQADAEAEIALAKSEEEVRLVRAETEAEIAQIQEELRVQIERNNQQLAIEAQWANTQMNVVRYLALGLSLALSVGVAYVLCRLAHLIPVRAPTPATAAVSQPLAPPEPWYDPAYRAWRIAQARSRELKDRQQQSARRTETPERVISGNGHHPRRVLGMLSEN